MKIEIRRQPQIKIDPNSIIEFINGDTIISIAFTKDGSIWINKHSDTSSTIVIKREVSNHITIS